MLNLLLLAGATGCGKTYIKELLINSNNNQSERKNKFSNISFHSPIQITTRPKRIYESLDDYIFLEKYEEYEKLKNNGKLIAEIDFNGYNYGTLKSNLIYGKNVINVIVVSFSGLLNTLNYYKNAPDVNVKTALILSDPTEEILKEHNGRTIEGFKNELFILLNQSYDYYIPNYRKDRITLNKLLEVLNK